MAPAARTISEALEPKRLKQAVFVSRRQQQREVRNRDALGRPSRLATGKVDLALVDRQIKSRLMFFR